MTHGYITTNHNMHNVIVVLQARVHCLICMHKPEGEQHLRVSADISDNVRVPVLQLICCIEG